MRKLTTTQQQQQPRMSDTPELLDRSRSSAADEDLLTQQNQPHEGFIVYDKKPAKTHDSANIIKVSAAGATSSSDIGAQELISEHSSQQAQELTARKALQQ